MSEYSYSPEAYERFAAMQTRVSHWVDDTSKHPSVDPFTPPTVAGSTYSPPPKSRLVRSSHHHRRHDSSDTSGTATPHRAATYHSHSRRPTHVRSHSSDSVYPYDRRRSHQPSRHSTQRSGDYSRRYRSSSIEPVSTRAMGYQPIISPSSPTYVTSPHPVVIPASRESSRGMGYNPGYSTIAPNPSSPTYVNPSLTEPLVVPISGGECGYVVVPPRGRTMEIMFPEQEQQKRPARNRSLFQRILNPFSASGASTWSRRSKSVTSRRRSSRDSY
ncbi:hypothetical protein BDQ12DRAFT_685259 [Crucibulum laeve]|uniref:Uncharacterized protein n=1 Tax=Crucibulum laeve TaxID=68775 RepID=A0A5C3LX30_9AGAR|nr:hypothetical protein BDQ12DRAFT_685259 [Crucibulum laeve]